MAHALETRVPFLDHRLIDYVMSIPEGSNGSTRPKALLVDALRGLLPEEVTSGAKRGFALPMDEWMRGSLRDYCMERLAAGKLRAAGVMRGESIDRLWTSFLDRSASWASVWLLVVLEDWIARNRVEVAA
jgi:asparagine synthase (glutamine-hydrolysing)